MNYSRYFIFIFIISFILPGFAVQALADQKIKVITTLPLLEDFAENIGKDRIEVRSLLTGMESEHTYSPKPSDIVSVKEAMILIKVGLGLEVWVDALIRNASNKSLIVVTTSRGVPLLENEETDLHGHDSHAGNPHIWLDPENAKLMIRHITRVLSEADPEWREFYMSNQSAFFEQIDAMHQKIREELSQISNRRIITQHPAWPYFAERFGLEISDNIQPQVGTEPSAKHIAHIINRIRRENIRVIVSEPQMNPKIPQAIAEETGARIVMLTPIPGGLPGTESYISMMDYIGKHLADALK